MDLYGLFPVVREWRKCPEKMRLSTMPEDFLPSDCLQLRLLLKLQYLDHHFHNLTVLLHIIPVQDYPLMLKDWFRNLWNWR